MPLALRRRVLPAAITLAVSCSMTVGAYPIGIQARSLSEPHLTRHTTAISFVLNGPPDVELAGVWVGMSKGWFRQAGFEASWKSSNSPESDVPRQAGNTFGLQTGTGLAVAISKGVPIRALYAGTQVPLFDLIALMTNGIYQIGQLKGKRIGYPPQELFIAAAMMSCKPQPGLSARDWKPVPVANDPSQLTSGHVDAYLARPREVDALINAGAPTNAFLPSDYCVHFYDNVLFTTDRLIRINPALVKTVVGVVARGFQWAFTHPDATAALVVAKYLPPPQAGLAAQITQRQHETAAIRELAARAGTGRNQYHGGMNNTTWQSTVNLLARYRQITRKPSVTSIYTNQFNPFTH